MTTNELLTFDKSGRGMLEATLDIGKLYKGHPKERENFKRRFSDFDSHISNKAYAFNERKLFELKGDLLIYQTEQIIVPQCNSRKPLLLMFGNPASHSVSDGMFFAYKNTRNGGKIDHPLWKVLKELGYLTFESDNSSDKNMSIVDRGQRRKGELLELKYTSPFCISMAVYYSMPTPSSGPLGQVEGLKKLFGSEALHKIGKSEKQNRINLILKQLSKNGGAVLAFQKDAYNGIKSDSNQVYSQKDAFKSKLIGECDNFANVMLLCSPPTRAIGWAATKKVLTSFYEILNPNPCGMESSRF